MIKKFFKLATDGLSRKKIIIITSLVVLAGLITVSVFFLPNGFFQKLKDKISLFDGFRKLILTGAEAHDNFELKALNGDSLGVEIDSAYLLTSKEDVSTSDVKNIIKIEPDVDFSLDEKGKNEWQLNLDETLDPNTILKISMATAFIDENSKEQDRYYEWAFQVKDNFKVLSNIPRDIATNVPTNTGIEVTFSHDNFYDYEKYFSIEPQVEGRFEKHGRTLVFVPKSLEAGKIYNIVIKKGLPLSDSKETLAEDFSFAFETQVVSNYNNSKSSSWFSTYRKLHDVNTSEQPIIQLSAVNIDSLDVAVYPLDGEAEYLRILEDRDKLPWWAYSKDYYLANIENKKALTSFSANVETEKNTKFVRFPSSLPKGYFIVDLKKGNSHDQVILQVSDLASYINVSKNKSIVWAVDLSTKKPARDAQIELIGTDQKFFTNTSGVAEFDSPTELLNKALNTKENKRYYFRVSSGDKSVILPAGTISRSYGYYYDYDTDAIDYWKYFYTDRPMYQPTDNIKFWGMVKERDNDKINDEVTITLYKEGYVDYYYRPVVIDKKTIEIDNLGVFSGEMNIKDLRADYYALELKIGDKLIERKYLQIEPYTKPAYQITLIPDKKLEFADNEIKLEATASFFEGTPVPDLPLIFQTPEGEKVVKTDQNGKVALSYTKKYSDCSNEYSCWPDYAWLNIKPQLAELADISAGASVRFYGPNVHASYLVKYPQAGKGRVEIKARKIDLSKLGESYGWNEEDRFGNLPAVNTKIEGEVIKVTYTSRETGTSYDFISKRTYKTYSYDRKEEKVDNFTGYTDQNGNFVYERDLEPETSYMVKMKYYDEAGRNDSMMAYMYYYDGQGMFYYDSSQYDIYRLKMPENERFSVGEKVNIDFIKNEASLPDGNDNYYLFLQAQNGLQEYSVGQNSEYSFNFENRDIPNVNIAGVYFNGDTFIVSETGWSGNSVMFDTNDKLMSIDVKTDKDKYKPGEKVNLSISTRDKSGEPLSATVNLNLIDEAFYALMDDQANPIESIYAGIGSGSIFSTYSHTRPQSSFGGAEKGGCFLSGTQILMSDGKNKNIEDIVLGDEVMTLSDPRTNHKTTGVVTELYQHVISEYVIINDNLKVTPEHLIYTNFSFRPAGTLKLGDWLLDSSGQIITITSIDKQREVVPVYNFKVEPQHTYFANGIFVHNEKGGGPREFFTDAALFQTVKTNGSGSANLSFTLPDNITSWRVTAQGISSNMDVGLSVSKVPVSLPAFTEVTMGKEYLAGDEPMARLRSFGTAFNSGDKVKLSLLSPALGINEPISKDSEAFKYEFFQLPKLPLGSFDVTYSLDSDKGKDAIKLPLETVSSRLMVQLSQSTDASTGLVLTNDTAHPMAITLADKRRGAVYQTLRWLSWTWGDRVDQALSRVLSQELLAQMLDYKYSSPQFIASQYQMNSGGITLLPYSSEDLELSARVAALDSHKFDDVSLKQYFFRKLENKESNIEEVTLALYGLASMGEPVLQRLDSWAQREDLGVKLRLYIALSYYKLGNGEKAREIYFDILKEFGQVKEPHIVIKAGENEEYNLINTALAANLAALLNEPQQVGLFEFLRFNKPKEILLNLEELNFVKANLPYFSASTAKVSLEIDNEKLDLELKEPNFNSSFELQPKQTLKIIETAPNLVLVSNKPVPMTESGLTPDEDISISRSYYVDGKKTNTFKETDLIEVRLLPEFDADALDGYYQITDILPSGLLPVTAYYRGGGMSDCNYWYPYNNEGQKVKYMINRNWRNWYCGSYIKYYARVKTKGNYIAEPAIIQSMLNPDFVNFSKNESIKIE